ncbi:MAG: cytochrome c-type biogenesis protein [Xanthobacteraceae bacterium]
MARRFLALIVAVVLAWPVAALAVQPDEIMPDPAQEARARALSREIRCMVCQNQSIDDSDASLARDLRLLVRERIAEGDSDREVRDFLVARYGAFVLLKPPFDLHTLLLWLLPPLVLIGGALALWRRGRARTRLALVSGDRPPPLTPQEEATLKALLADAPAPAPGGEGKITKD